MSDSDSNIDFNVEVPETTTGPHFDELHDAVLNTSLILPTGRFALRREDLILYYGKGSPADDLGRIDFSHTDDEALERLFAACDPATFGRNKEDVLDESYRKAGKLDTAHFCTHFDPARAGLISVIARKLLDGRSSKTRITAELYKLNVYGPGSFFKTHKDTPRGTDMLASLVVVLPTIHEGGALVFRHNGHEVTFDSATVIREAKEDDSFVAYAAFFCDIEHEVEQVTSGYRVTLTYNLRFQDNEEASMDGGSESIDSLQEYQSALESTFRAALADPQFLPDGGLVGFGLRHEYSGKLIPSQLKGSDAALFSVCERLSLAPALHIVYFDSRDTYVVCDGIHDLPEAMCDEDIVDFLVEECGGRKLVASPSKVRRRKQQIYVHWTTPMKANNIEWDKDTLIAYGNEPYLAEIYHCACLVVQVAKRRTRISKKK